MRDGGTGQTGDEGVAVGEVQADGAADILYLVDRLEELVGIGKRVPFSNRVMVEEADFLALVDQLRATVPNEVRQAQRVIGERAAIIAEAQGEAAKILDVRPASRPNTSSLSRASSTRPGSGGRSFCARSNRSTSGRSARSTSTPSSSSPGSRTPSSKGCRSSSMPSANRPQRWSRPSDTSASRPLARFDPVDACPPAS